MIITHSLTCYFLETAAHKVHISSPHHSSFQDSFSRTKLRRCRLRSNPAYSHLPIACCCSKRILRCPRHGRSPAAIIRCPSRTFTQSRTLSSSRRQEPVSSEMEPCGRPAARGRVSSRARSRDRMNTRPRSPVRWSTLPCAGAHVRQGIFPRASRRCRWRELRSSTGRCLCASPGSRWIGLDG